MALRIAAVSDLHGYLPEITTEIDIFIIAGDISPLEIQFNKPKMKTWLETEFAYWIKELPVDKVYMIAGNHDAYFEDINQMQLAEFKTQCDFKLIYLENNYIVHRHEGQEYKIFGTPYCHIFGNWPFMVSEETLINKFKEIPDNVDIIISHDPPFSYGDVDVSLGIPQHRNQRTFFHLGNKPLSERLTEINYKLLVCGHIHSGDHTFNEQWKVVNVSYLNEVYQPAYPIFYTQLTK